MSGQLEQLTMSGQLQAVWLTMSGQLEWPTMSSHDPVSGCLRDAEFAQGPRCHVCRHYNNHLMEENEEEGNPLKGDLPKPFNDKKTVGHS